MPTAEFLENDAYVHSFADGDVQSRKFSFSGLMMWAMFKMAPLLGWISALVEKNSANQKLLYSSLRLANGQSVR